MAAFWTRLRARAVLLEGLGNVVAGLLAILWLQIPDSHAWEFVLSMVFAVVIALGFLWMQTTVVRMIRLGGAGRAPWAGMGWMALWLGVWRVLVVLVDKLSVHAVERAGYWNSRLSAHERTFFTETRLEDWQNDAISTLLWFVLPGLLLPLLVETVSGGRVRAAVRAWRRWQIWLAVGVGSVAGCWIAGKLTDWHPADSVRGEVVSATARIGLAYVVLVAIGLVVVAIVAEMLSRKESAETGADEGVIR